MTSQYHFILECVLLYILIKSSMKINAFDKSNFLRCFQKGNISVLCLLNDVVVLKTMSLWLSNFFLNVRQFQANFHLKLTS